MRELDRYPYSGHSALLGTCDRPWQDTEFTLEILDLQALHSEVKITLLQCRPQSHIQDAEDARLPEELPEANVILSTRLPSPSQCGQGPVRRNPETVKPTNAAQFRITPPRACGPGTDAEAGTTADP